MARGKREKKDDWVRYKKIHDENSKLKKEVTKLRKLVKETVIDSLDEKQKRQDEGLEVRKPLCEVCGNDNLTAIDIPRADGTFSFNLCNSCGHRSAMKRKKEIKTK
jgi:predicted Zn-ribbon and HTH transcriptional regulator